MRRLMTVAVVLTLGLTACGSSSEPAESVAGAETPLGVLTHGDPLPDATLSVLGEDASVAMSDLVGTPMIINFWATWCAFCVDEMPDLEQAHQALGDQVRFVGIDREDVVSKALDLAAETGVSYRLLEDVDGSYFHALKARGMPTTVFVDADGVIQYRHAGPITSDELLGLAAEHLDTPR